MVGLICLVWAVQPTIINARGLVGEKIEPIQIVQFKREFLPIVKNKLQPTKFNKGWCTYWVAVRRAKMGKPVTWSGNAAYWFENAKAQGYEVTSVPSVGAIYVTRAENSKGTRSGHVALVIDVRENGIVVEEMNFKGWNRVNTRWVSNEKLAQDRVGFVT